MQLLIFGKIYILMTFIEYLQSQRNVHVLEQKYEQCDFFKLDLSEQNTELQDFDLKNVDAFQDYIDRKAKEAQATIAYGGYLEPRLIYRHNTIFKNPSVEERNIHLGIDLWLEAHSPIFCALSGRVHSFQNNQNAGDYGPTIILEHEWNDTKFFTLYGHLSTESLAFIEIGQAFRQGDFLAKLGFPSENGNYAPHLHFQIILDLENNVGDYPGVCSKEQLQKYANNCPNPLYLLNLSI